MKRARFNIVIKSWEEFDSTDPNRATTSIDTLHRYERNRYDRKPVNKEPINPRREAFEMVNGNS
jgi:hypothetical protein